MIDVEFWLIWSAIISLGLQAGSLSRARTLSIVVLLILSATYALADTLAHFSVLDLHNGLLPVAGVWAGWLLFESLLLSRWQMPLAEWWGVCLPGFWIALLYLQMHFYQVGWVAVTFDYQAMIFGSLIAILYSALFFLSKRYQKSVNVLLALMQWVFIFVCFSSRPNNDVQVHASTETLLTTVLLFTCVVLLGYVGSRIGAQRFNLSFWK